MFKLFKKQKQEGVRYARIRNYCISSQPDSILCLVNGYKVLSTVKEIFEANEDVLSKNEKKFLSQIDKHLYILEILGGLTILEQEGKNRTEKYKQLEKEAQKILGKRYVGKKLREELAKYHFKFLESLPLTEEDEALLRRTHYKFYDKVLSEIRKEEKKFEKRAYDRIIGQFANKGWKRMIEKYEKYELF